MTTSLQGKNILITGGTSGIGKACVQLVLSLGGSAIVLGRNRESISELLNEYNERLTFHSLDLSESNEIELFLKGFLRSYEVVHAFIHAAGLSPTRAINSSKKEGIDVLLQINVWSALEISKNLFRSYKSNGLTSIVYISSVMSTLSQKGKGLYSISKASLDAMMRSQALEYARYNVRVNTVAPAVVRTPLIEKSTYSKSDLAFQNIQAQHPLGIGEPNDVASAIIFLVSDSSRWITGTSLRVDGGYSLQ